MKAWSSAMVFALPVAAVAMALACGRAVQGEDFQDKTVAIYVSNPGGGGYDLDARILARHTPGHPDVIVSNMPGAHGIRGANYIYNVAAKDGTALRAAFDATMKGDKFLGDCQQSKVDVNPRSGADLQKIVAEMVDIKGDTRMEVRQIAGRDL
jgi:tripartite-type tricarboxylate transporter receptor subunit TctC